MKTDSEQNAGEVSRLTFDQGMVVACLGWGSLVWNPGGLNISSAWRTDGPTIPVEFARQSDNGRITLVVTGGAPEVPVLWATLAVDNIEKAKAELALREGISSRNISASIGYWTRTAASRGPETEAISRWAATLGLDGVVWTALRPRFAKEYRTPSQTEVVAYLASLIGEQRLKAEKYCRRAPAQIKTPYRTLIESRLGWVHEPGISPES
jgi:hypothetical protein